MTDRLPQVPQVPLVPATPGAPARPHLLDVTMFWNASGGVRRYVSAKHDWLRRHADWRCSVATPTPDAPEVLRMPSLPLPGGGGHYRFAHRRGAAANLLQAMQPSLIESADPYRLAWSTRDAAAALGIPAVAFCHSNLVAMARHALPPALHDLTGRSLDRAVAAYARHVYGGFDLVLAPSRAMAAHLSDWGVTAEHQPLGVDTGLFQPARRSSAWRASLGLPADARLLVFTGRFAPEKQLGTLVDAVAALGAPYWLVAIGDGPVPPRGDRVRVVAPITEPTALAAAIANCDAFVHAGRQETFGLSALEAMACGLPLIVAAVEGLGELVDASVGQGVTGGATDFAAAIEATFARDLQQLGRAARARADGRAWQAVLPLLLARYRRLLRLPEPTAP